MSSIDQFEPRLLDFSPYYSDEMKRNRPLRRSVDELPSDQRYDVAFIATSPVPMSEFLPGHPQLVQEAQETGGGILVDRVRIMGGAAVGAFVLLGYGGQDVMQHPGEMRKATEAGVGYAAYEMGASVAGLGALTVPVTNKGLTAQRYVQENGLEIRVNHGDDATAYFIANSVKELGLTSSDSLQVIGAKGVVGKGVAAELALLEHPLDLYGKPEHRDALEEFADKLRSDPQTRASNIHVTTNPEMLVFASVSVLVTSGGQFEPSMFREDSVVVDGAIPRATNYLDRGWNDRGIVLSTEGGQGRVSSEYLDFDPIRWGVQPDRMYSCAGGVFYDGLRAAQGKPVYHHVGETYPPYTREVGKDMQEVWQWHFPGFNPSLLGERALRNLAVRLQR